VARVQGLAAVATSGNYQDLSNKVSSVGGLTGGTISTGVTVQGTITGTQTIQATQTITSGANLVGQTVQASNVFSQGAQYQYSNSVTLDTQTFRINGAALAAVATGGDLLVARVQGLATVATSGNYQDLINKVSSVGGLAGGTISSGVTVQGTITGTQTIQATGIIGGSAFQTAGTIQATQTISGGAFQTGGAIQASQTITGGSLSTAGTIQANQTISSQTGDVIAYASDDRLKTKLGNIQGALEKVNSLNGFIYKFNDLANSFGFTNQGTFAGVSAQELEKVLPEVVKPAPFDSELKSGNNYMTVQYEKVVPLLIESIKELARENKTLSENLRIVSEHIGLVPKPA
jgi:hypothetical protein